MTPTPRVRRLPVRSVLVELVGTPDDVEAEPTALPTEPPVAGWRRWGWVVAFVPTVALVVYQRTAAGRDWPVPEAVVFLAMLGLVATALLALVRYRDDRSATATARQRRSLLDRPVRVTGTFAPTGPDDAAAGLLTVTPSSGEAITRPVRVVVPPGAGGPRPGDPVAVWHAHDDEDATGVLLVRYHRAWADDVLAALRGTAAGTDQEPAADESTPGEGA